MACNQTIPATAGTSRADVLAAQAPEDAWKRRSCGDGAKGPRLFDWAVASLPTDPDTTPPGWSRWLLVRRSLTPNSKGELELAYDRLALGADSCCPGYGPYGRGP